MEKQSRAPRGDQHWIREMKAENKALKQVAAMRGLADYIAHTYSPYDQDRLIALMADPTKQVNIEITVTERKGGG